MPDSSNGISSIVFRHRGLVEYVDAWKEMKSFTDNRNEHTHDEVWLLQHPPVYTQGQAGKAEHILSAGNIPVVQVDRGGQVTYHGPGQLVVYFLLDIKRRKLGVRELVTLMEESLVELLASFDLSAYPKPDAPGVYVDLNDTSNSTNTLDSVNTDGYHPSIVHFEKNEAKIASLGLRVRKGCTFHGLSLNINCDLTPFDGINPCGYAGMKMTRLNDLTSDTRCLDLDLDQIAILFESILKRKLFN